VPLQPAPTEKSQQLPDARPSNPEVSEHLTLVALVGDPKRSGQADGPTVLPQDLHTKGVQGPPRDVLRGMPQRFLEPEGDFLGGFVGKGDGADPIGAEPQFRDEVVHPTDQTERLPRPGTGDDQHWSEGCVDRFTLFREGRERH
jgi:hypothetical protein